MDKKQFFEGKTYYKINTTEEVQNDVFIKNINHELKSIKYNKYLILAFGLVLVLIIIILLIIKLL